MSARTARLTRLVGGLLIVAAGAAAGYRLAESPAPPPPVGAAGKRALLVGVTKYEYDHPALPPLDEPVNDVALMRGLLTGPAFGFDPAAVVCLTEDAGKPERRPTQANIEREFRALVAAANAGDQVMVLLSGHGSQQQEAVPPHPDHPEPDGLDEVFQPADVGPVTGLPGRSPTTTCGAGWPPSPPSGRTCGRCSTAATPATSAERPSGSGKCRPTPSFPKPSWPPPGRGPPPGRPPGRSPRTST